MIQKTPECALVVGLGQTGLSCVRFLRGRGYAVVVADDQRDPPLLGTLRAEFPDVELRLGGLTAQALAGCRLLVVSPGVSLHQPALEAAVRGGAEAVGDIELFARQARAPVIAITGSNGKSTVTALTGLMCQRAGMDTAVGGNIGVPALSLLRDPEPAVYVLELSSFQLETTSSLRPAAAALLNISADHLDRYTSIDDYARAKARIFHGDGVAVVNADDPRCVALAPRDRRVLRFGLSVAAGPDDYGVRTLDGSEWLVHGDEPLLPARDVPLPGRHNIANVLAAAALAQAVGVPTEAVRRAVGEFHGLAHRTQVVADYAGVRWINDSKGTNVGATLAALGGMDRPVVLIAGGIGKGADFGPLREAVGARARAVVLIGRDAGAIEAALAGAAPVQRAGDMQDAVDRAAALAHSGDAVLLSPACASFDMFDNYMHRGDVFTRAVMHWIACNSD